MESPKKPEHVANNDELSELPVGYPWPASRLSSNEMKQLRIIAHAVNKPTTRLLQDAVKLLWDATESERLAAQVRVEELQQCYRRRCDESQAAMKFKKGMRDAPMRVAEIQSSDNAPGTSGDGL